MAEVRAFRGVRYHLDQPESAVAVISPPYDVISPADQQALLERHPRNVIRLELPVDEPGDDAEDNRYTRAAALYRKWLDDFVLQAEPEAALYVYGQRYTVEGRSQERLGLIGALKVEPYEAGVVLPHEQTFPKHKEDRFRLLSAARAQFSPIFGLYSAPEAEVRDRLAEVAAGEPDAVATDPEGVEHRLWAVSDPGFITWAEGVFAGKQMFIADGHHRYETALRYREERRKTDGENPEAPFESVMTFLVEMDDPGLVLLPTHRLVRAAIPAPEELRRRLSEQFEVEAVPAEVADELRHHQIGVVLPGGASWRLTLRDPHALDRLDQEHSPAWRDLDVVLLHRLIFAELLGITEHGDIVYTRSPQEALNRAVSGEFSASFLLPTPTVEELKLVAGAGDKMPEKSTYFWPKAVTGLVIYPE
jgi:uncharacterized protein (DUF1015 family)